VSRKILIDDLRAPVLTEEQAQLMEEAERHPVELTVDAVLAAAVERVGLDDFGVGELGAGDFRERLHLILSEVDENPNATALVRAGFYAKTVAVAATRLQAIDLLRRHPEIHEIEIERPIIVAGLPRSGTTHLLGLIGADTRLRSLPYWESVQPIPLPGEEAAAGGVDPRYARSEQGWERLQRINPMMAPYHPMDPDHIHEDLETQLPDFSTYYWEWMFRLPRWRDYYLSHDQTPHYEFGKTMLKIMAWQDGVDRRWVLKCPQHFEQIRPIMNVYPDALVVFTHRDPVASLQSIVTQIAYVIRTREKTVDPDYYFEYWVDRVQRLLEAYVRDVDLIPAEQRFDVDFDAFVRNDLGTVEQIYAAAGLPMTEAARAEIQRYLDDHQRGKHGAIDHDLRRDFGADPEELRRRFSFYVDRVAVPVEAR
jgi:hypothetical protein